MDGPNSASHAVFIDTTLETHLALLVSDVDNVSDLKKKVVHEHLLCFPEIGEIKVESMRVERKGCFYHLSDTMLVKSAFAGVKGNWFLSVVGSRILKCNQKDPPSDPVSSSLLAYEKSSLQSDGPLKLAICDALSSEQVRSQFFSQNDLKPGPLCPDSAKNILNDIEMEVEHDNHCKTSSSERSEHGVPEQSKQTGELMIMLGGYAESKEVSAANVVMHSAENLDGNNRTECGALKKQKVRRKDEDELLGHALNVNDTSVDKLPQNTTEAVGDAVHVSPIGKSEEALNSPNKQSNDEPERSSHVTTTQGDAVKIDQLNDKDITFDKVSREVSKSGAVKKKCKAQKLSGCGGLSMDREAEVSNTVDDSRNMRTSDDHFAARNSIKGRKKKKTKSSCLQEVPTGISSLRDARGDSSKRTLEIENKVPDEEPEVETFQRSVKTNSEPEGISLGEMGSHHHDQEAGDGVEQHDLDFSEAHPGNTENKDAASKLSRAKDHQVTMTDVPGKHNLSHTDKILSGTTEVAGSFKVDVSGLSMPYKSGKKSKSKKTIKSDRDRQAASGFVQEDGLVDANASIEKHEVSNTHSKTSKSTDQACQTEVGGELLQKSSLAVDLPQERRASERDNIVANTTEVDSSSMMDMDTNGSEEPQKSGKKRKLRKAAKSGGKTHGKPDTGHGDGVFSAIASIENHRDLENDSVHKPLDQTEDRIKFLHESGSELVLPQKLEAYDTDNIDVNVTKVASLSKLDALVESQKSSKTTKSKKTTKAGGAENDSKDNKPIDQTEEESGGLQKICPDLVLPEHEASVLERFDAGTTEVGGSSTLNEVQELRKSGKKGRMKKAAKSGGVKQAALGLDHEDGMMSVKAVWTAAVRERHLMNENTENFSASSSTSKGTVLMKEKKVDHYKVTAKKEYDDSKGETLNRTNQKKSLLSISGNIFKDGNDENSADNDAESDASTRTPSDNSLSSDSEVEENMETPVKGTQVVKKKNDKNMKMSGLKDMALDNILRRSSSFKKAKLSASQLEEETESQTVDIVPDSQAGL